MMVTIVTLTERARRLAEEIREKLINDPTILSVEVIHRNMDLRDVFAKSDVIVGIMAAGIMVRKMAPLISNKLSDPGVLVVDEMGSNVISLLSGHAGGANDFAIKLAGLIGANPVITTSTDVNGLVGIDTFAARYFYRILDPHLIRYFNSSIIRGQRVELHSSRNLEALIDDDMSRTYSYVPEGDEIVRAHCNSRVMRLAPLKLSMGIGTRRGVGSDRVIALIMDTLKLVKIPPERLDAIATGYMKREEGGIMEAARLLGVPLEFIGPEELESQDTHSFSEFVHEKFGVGSVCEAAALSSAGKDSKLVIRKTKANGVTAALAVSGKPKSF